MPRELAIARVQARIFLDPISMKGNPTSRHHGWRAPPEAIFFGRALSNHTYLAKMAPKPDPGGGRDLGQTGRAFFFLLFFYVRAM